MKQIVVAGRLTRDAEIRAAGDGTVTSFSVACDDRKKVDGQWVKVPVYFTCAVWGKRGTAIAEYLRKGAPVTVCGELRPGMWQDRNGGWKLDLRIDVSEVALQGSRGDGGHRDERREDPKSDFGADDDIPF